MVTATRNPDWVPIEQAAPSVGKSAQTLKKWAKAGRVDLFYIGKTPWTTWSSVNRLDGGRERAPSAPPSPTHEESVRILRERGYVV